MPVPRTPEERGQCGLFGDLFGDLFSMRPAGPLVMTREQYAELAYVTGKLNIVIPDDECPFVFRPLG